MKTRGSKLCAALVAALVLMAFSAPAAATWWSTSASPLTYQFADNNGNVYNDPQSGAYKTYANAPNNTKYSDFIYTEVSLWTHTFSAAGTGSLAIQSNGNSPGRSLTFCSSIIKGQSNFNVVGLNWTNGIVYEIKAKSVGDKDGVSGYPPGYNWGGSYGVGGAEFNFANLAGGPAGLFLSWRTFAADDPSDDRVGVHSFGLPEFAGLNYPLGGTPTSAPEHVYKLTTRRSPLPLTPSNDKQLVNVYVDAVRVITNKNVQYPGDNWGDGIGFGTREVHGSPRGDVYDYLKIYEADPIVDPNNPTLPTNLTATAQNCNNVTLTWDAGTDPGGEVIGYRIKRNGVEIGYSEGTCYGDTGLTPSTSYSYEVRTMDQVGNVSTWAGPAVVVTPPSFGGAELTFDFDDVGNVTFTQASSPNYFHSNAEESSSFWMGKKGGDCLPMDGNVIWEGDSNLYKAKFEVSGGDGSLSCFTSCPGTSQDTGRFMVESSDFGDWFKWLPNRGMKVTADVRLIGDEYGWCAAWGDFPFVATCDVSSADHGHQASDWGTCNGELSGVMLSVDDALGGNGTQCWVNLSPGNVRDASDDRVLVRTQDLNLDVATFEFKDGLGLGLTAEDGSANGCKDGAGTPYPRNGVIEGDCNRLVVTAAVMSAGGDNEYWDIWVSRPGGTPIHLDPGTCNCTTGMEEPDGPTFGANGHTMMFNYEDRDNLNSRLMIGNQVFNQVWGLKYDSIKLRNDWNGDIYTPVQSLSDLRSLGVGTPVRFDSTTGGSKVVTTLLTWTGGYFDPHFFYVEQQDRSSGVRIIPFYDPDNPPTPTKGKEVSVRGVLMKDADGNLYVDTRYGNVTFGAAVGELGPVGMTNKSVDGKEVTGGFGTANAGLLGTVWGIVSNVTTDSDFNLWFTLDDGSGTPVLVVDYWWDGIVPVTPQPGEYWCARGIVGLKKQGADYVRMLMVEEDKAFKAGP